MENDKIYDMIEELLAIDLRHMDEEEKKMRKELGDFVQTCCKFHLQELHSEFKRMVRNKI